VQRERCGELCFRFPFGFFPVFGDRQMGRLLQEARVCFVDSLDKRIPHDAFREQHLVEDAGGEVLAGDAGVMASIVNDFLPVLRAAVQRQPVCNEWVWSGRAVGWAFLKSNFLSGLLTPLGVRVGLVQGVANGDQPERPILRQSSVGPGQAFVHRFLGGRLPGALDGLVKTWVRPRGRPRLVNQNLGFRRRLLDVVVKLSGEGPIGGDVVALEYSLGLVAHSPHASLIELFAQSSLCRKARADLDLS